MATPQLPIRQAGGGASGAPELAQIKTLEGVVLTHLKKIFRQNIDQDGIWTKARIEEFVKTTQEDSRPLPKWLAEKEFLDWEGFAKYMACPESNAMAVAKKQDLSWPLASYFINSSHNTYLTGNQLSSKSKAKAYTSVLLRGCRCVEVDVWDGDEVTVEDPAVKKKSKLSYLKQKLKSKIGESISSSSSESEDSEDEKAFDKDFPATAGVIEPKVYHGYTATEPVSFRRCCVAILKDAFTASDLPLVVSLEVHCSPAQQEIMAEIMKEVWAGHLLPEPKKDPTQLPAPELYRNKILIKVKYAPPIEGGEEAAAEDANSDYDDASPEAKKKAKPSKIIHVLSDMGVYTRGVSFKSFDQPEAKMPTHIFSLSEKKVADVEHKDIMAHNMRYMMRSYPHGLRFSSSNLDPAPLWNKGIQVVALNWQNWDEGMMLNEGMFAGTDGYVLKPQGYRYPGFKDIPPTDAIRLTLDLTITILAAQNLPLPPDTEEAKDFDSYVKCEIHVGEHVGADGVEAEGEYKLKTQAHKGVSPDFSSEILRFQGITGVVDELTFVRFTVRDEELGRDDLASWACVRLDRLQPGYRFIHLLDTKGRVTDGVLFVKIAKKLA